ncbi:MAG TPA: AmmeMemoRadiSam system protein B [Methanoregulaceae archaeon]|nr:MAG: AmmeMemoRadiSam system protein B [Methanolinea sp.]HON81184.1 AmmeMemoRadiSam system protein B [Methanoregulaceae archaeon]HPD09872.1 AmmeMemoRadiSam system protein B [Methanoregulaceae archaeon]HRT14937.1 AmmeMemoRadiSam system protein B [Methanoregulaceae archaeon]HRU30448.1 AmmeMemoRadiSam system protein B [Methanoregulaceae archaeon]
MKIRTCAVAGVFYPRDPHHLEQVLGKFFHGKETGLDARGIVAPHAGYPYSGEVAAWAYSAIPASFAGTFILVGPSHRGFGTCISRIAWETPLGIVDIDPEIADALDIKIDEVSHLEEHSLEVQVPFIKYRFPRTRIVPILMGDQGYKSASLLAERVLDALRRTNRDDVRLIASSDFSHYVPAAQARENDRYAIAALDDLDIPAFYRRVAERGVSACGVGPIAVVCLVCRALGARRGQLLHYATSGDVTGDPTVVGYGAVAVM